MLLACPDAAVGKEGQYRKDYQEQHCGPSRNMPVLQLGFSGPHQECGNVLRVLILGGLGAIIICHLTIARQWRGHREIEVREIRVVMQTSWRFCVGESLQQIGGLILVSRHKRIDIRRAIMTRLGDEREIRWQSVVVRRTRRRFIGKGRRNMVSRERRPR